MVLDLQREAMDRNAPIIDLLRKAFVISKKLHISDFEKWAEQELNGYYEVSTNKIPKYRHITGEIRGWNEYHGWQPVIITDPRIMEKLSTRACNQGIAEIESLVKNFEADKGAGQIQMKYDAHTNAMLGKATGHQTEFCIMAPPTSLVRMLDAVRTIILNWSLKLEEDGILGEGLVFTPKEKKAAENIPQNVTNFYGPVQSSQIQQQTTDSSQVMNIQQADLSDIKDFLEAIQKEIKELKLSDESWRELEAEIKTAEVQISSPKPKHRIIRESLSTIRHILETAAGGVGAKLLIEYGPLLTSWFQ